MVHGISSPQYACIRQIWDSYLKEYRRYAPDLVRILETRSQAKVTVTRKWDGTFSILRCTHTPNSYHKLYKRYALDMSMLRITRSEVKVKVTQKWYAALPHPTMHLNTKFGILTSKNIGDMHQTQCQLYKQG